MLSVEMRAPSSSPTPFADALRHLRRETLSRVTSTPLARDILSGKASREGYAGYLFNVFQYAQHSARVIGMAGARCVGTAPHLAEYLFRHAGEELGHEDWARSDLHRLGYTDEDIQATRPSPSCTAMIALEYYTAAFGNPVALFGWMYVLESLGDDIAHAVARQVSSTLGQAGDVVYFLRGHGDADHAHAQEIEERLISRPIPPSDQADILHVARLSSQLYTGMVLESGTSGTS